jgi:hypothetical protein
VYRLYGLSNLGSLLALFAYPFVVEPLLGRHGQAAVWSTGMAAFAVLCAACAWIAGREIPKLSPLPSTTEPVAAPSVDVRLAQTVPATGWHRLVRPLLWVALPACASALLLGTTNAITQDIAPIPLLWVLPLALYLLTFVIAFDRPRWYVRKAWAIVLSFATIGVLPLLYMGAEIDSVSLVVGGFLAAMFAGCMTLHGELARLRPPPKQLTGYYLAIAAGGALGGLLVAVGAPLLLTSYSEYPAALWACCCLTFVTPCLVDRRMPSGSWRWS